MTTNLIETMASHFETYGQYHDLENPQHRRDIARAALSAIEAAGYRVVPVEPTEEMVKAFETPQVEFPLGNGQTLKVHGMTHYADNVWRLMLAAAPKVTP